MALRLSVRSDDFSDRFDSLITSKRETSVDVDRAVKDIIADVRQRGDDAVLDYTEKFDGHRPDQANLTVSKAEFQAARESCPSEIVDALELAHARIAIHHAEQIPDNRTVIDDLGVELGWRWNAVDSAGLYVPGGTASYPSSVLMNAVPAKAAGVGRISMAVPAPNGVINPTVLVAAQIAGVDEVIRIGGAQAIAALAYGTEMIAPVSIIVGPGNAYVAAAKRQVFGQVGIDMVAGPSEVLIVADGKNNPEWLAADLLAQAEHDTAAQAILISDDEALLDAVADAVDWQLKSLPREDIAKESWRQFGALIEVTDLAMAPDLINAIAPEHLELATEAPETMLGEIKHAGAIFLGHYTPEALGDYIAGTNHVLPTARSARFSSGLSVLDFMKRTSILRCPEPALAALAPSAAILADAEGLSGHARSLRIRQAASGQD